MQQREVMIDGSPFCVFTHGPPSGAPVVLLHALGFHARCWDQLLPLLPQDWYIVLPELRGHGRSSNKAPHTWRQLTSDLLAIMDSLALKSAYGVGHSMGGYCVADACTRRPDLFAHLLLIDPVIFSPEVLRIGRPESKFASVAEHPVARRRARFETVDEMMLRLQDRPPYSLWSAQILRDYCQYGLLPSSDGDYELACPGAVEAALYMDQHDEAFLEACRQIKQPVSVLRGEARDPHAVQLSFDRSLTWPDLAQQFPNGRDLYQPDLNHLMPMQEPKRVAAFITKVAQEHAGLSG